MLELIVPGSIAAISGGFIWMARNDKRIRDIDRRVDRVELRMAEDYVSKDSFHHSMARIENQLIRLEEKLDAIVQLAAKRD